MGISLRRSAFRALSREQRAESALRRSFFWAAAEASGWSLSEVARVSGVSVRAGGVARRLARSLKRRVQRREKKRRKKRHTDTFYVK